MHSALSPCLPCALRQASERCDARTSLEADAYAAWMGGNVLLEKESDWEGALARFLRAR